MCSETTKTTRTKPWLDHDGFLSRYILKIICHIISFLRVCHLSSMSQTLLKDSFDLLVSLNYSLSRKKKIIINNNNKIKPEKLPPHTYNYF